MSLSSGSAPLTAGASTCPMCKRTWIVTPHRDCCVPGCGCFGYSTGPDNPERPCEPCGLKHANTCTENRPKLRLVKR